MKDKAKTAMNVYQMLGVGQNSKGKGHEGVQSRQMRTMLAPSNDVFASWGHLRAKPGLHFCPSSSPAPKQLTLLPQTNSVQTFHFLEAQTPKCCKSYSFKSGKDFLELEK